jgi:hypothetical protein
VTSDAKALKLLLLSAVVLALAVRCGGNGGQAEEAGTGETSATEAEQTTTATEGGEAIVIREKVVIAAAPGAEPIATGDVLAGSTIGGSPFCAGGTIRDSHGSTDPAVRLIVQTITCPDGTLRLRFTPDEPQGLTQTGSWKIVGGTGAFEGLRGSGEMEVVYAPDEDSPAHVTFTGTVTR